MPTARIIKRESPTALARELPYWTRSADVSVTNEYLHDAAALASPAFLGLHLHLQQQRYRGYEFDDFLGSSLVCFLSFNNLFLQRLAVQAGELIPFNVRPFLGIRKLESAKARGFFAKAYLYRFLATGDESWLSAAQSCLGWLLENSSKQYPGLSWGNAFDFASRGGLIPKDRPTIVWTAHIAEAFDLAYDVTKKLEYLNALEQSARFIISALERHEDERGICFAYGPGAPALVFNSNLLGAATLLRWWKHSGDSTCFDLAQRAIAWTLPQINPDGSWHYGAGARYRWIDNFHTAYNIDCLVAAHELGGESVVPEAVIEKSYQFWTFWKNNLEAIHWGQSTMLAALGAYLYSVPTLGHKS